MYSEEEFLPELPVIKVNMTFDDIFSPLTQNLMNVLLIFFLIKLSIDTIIKVVDISKKYSYNYHQVPSADTV